MPSGIRCGCEQVAALRTTSTIPYHRKSDGGDLRELVEANVVLQMEHLKTYPEVARRVMSGDLAIDGWVLREDIGLVAEYHAERKAFLLRITQKIVPATPTRPN